MPSRRRLLAFALAAAPVVLAGAHAVAQSPDATPIEVAVGATVTVNIPRRPMIIDTENRAVATLEMQADGTGRVTGVAVGATRIIGQDFASVPILIPIRVVPPRAPNNR
jgi:hypothetical protein